MKPRCPKLIFPINLPALARLLDKKRIDIAPHRLEWELCARDIANALGEEGREVFHLIASVWPAYDRRDSEHCYDRALSRRESAAKHCPYIRRACRRHKIDLDTPQLLQGQACVLTQEETIAPKPEKKMSIWSIF